MGEGDENVRRIIRHKRTGLYLMDSGEWTSDLEKAHNWPSVLSAVRLARSRNLEDAELILKFEDENYDLRLDL
jgi:hypothetical protein